MYFRQSFRIGLGALLLVLTCGSLASAGGIIDLLFKKPYHGPAPSYGRNWSRFVLEPPGHQRYYVYNVPDYPWIGQGHAIPTYNWGYFGARYGRTVVKEAPYYDDYRGWSFRPAD